jgi:hypothetical protein
MRSNEHFCTRLYNDKRKAVKMPALHLRDGVGKVKQQYKDQPGFGKSASLAMKLLG